MCDKLYLKQGYSNPRIDECLREFIKKINNAPFGLKTLASCCGHGKYEPTIVIKNKSGDIYEMFSEIPLGPRKQNRYYKKDSEGFYYIPEVLERYNQMKRIMEMNE